MNQIDPLKTEKDELHVQQDLLRFARQRQRTSERVPESIARLETIGLSQVLQAERQCLQQRSYERFSIRQGELR